MGYDEDIYRKIADEYKQTRDAMENERRRRIEAVYETVPRIKEIRSLINAAGAENVRRVFADPSKKAVYNADLKKRINELENEKRSILTEKGIPLDYDAPRYKCDLCEDTGYIDGKKCVCFEQRLINEMYSMSNIDKILREQNFETFSFKFFSKDIYIDGETEYDRMKKIYDLCFDYCLNFDDNKKSFLFYGESGSGKTFMSSCIAKKLIDSGKTVVYMRASRLFMMYEDYRFGRSDKMRVIFDRLSRADLVIIDDLGTEIQNKSTVPFFLELMNERMQSGKKMIISTNLNPSDLSKNYTPRFTSRIYEFFMPLHFVFSDIRVKIAKESM